MSTATFDKVLYLETLKAAGIPEDQARAHAHALDEAMRDAVATNGDLREMELRMTVKTGGMIAAGVAVIAALMKLH